MSKSDPAERTVRDIRRKTRKQFSAEEKIRIVVSGLRGEESIAVLCRREGIGNVTPADTYFGRHTATIEKRKKIKKLTTQNRRLDHQRQAALHQTKMSQILPYETRSTVPFVLMTDTHRASSGDIRSRLCRCDWSLGFE